jgi:caffeoyl-CoA O-methyltransferase
MEIKEDIFKYIINHSDKEDPVLYDLSRKTHLETTHPRMLSGYLQGKFLEFISKMINPERILEIGTFTGYSAICLAKGLKKNGLLYTLEINDEREKIIREFVKKAGAESKINLIMGDAVESIRNISEVFDLVFIDADKPNYLNYYKAILPKVKKGGFVIVDNVLWDGKVVHIAADSDYSTNAIIQFNKYVQSDESVENFILPLRDGLMLIRKKD